MSKAILLLLFVPAVAFGQIYRWTDAEGRTHFSNSPPPSGVRSVVVDPNAKAGPPSPDTTECYTLRCQGERLEERQRRREAEEARAAAERAANAPREARYRGLEFRKYISIQRGMSEGEVLGIAGEPDLKSDQGIALAAPMTVQSGTSLRTAARSGLSLQTWTYMPTVADPFTTTITMVGGRVSEIERVRKF